MGRHARIISAAEPYECQQKSSWLLLSVTTIIINEETTNVKTRMKKRGRPYAGGRTTKVVRIPVTMDAAELIRLHNRIIPRIEFYKNKASESKTSVRYEKLIELLKAIDMW